MLILVRDKDLRAVAESPPAEPVDDMVGRVNVCFS